MDMEVPLPQFLLMPVDLEDQQSERIGSQMQIALVEVEVLNL
jgi:hypothetical protein